MTLSLYVVTLVGLYVLLQVAVYGWLRLTEKGENR